MTAVEINPDIAKIYQDFFSNDKIIIDNAHDYLLDHYKEYDFIWSSPPCQTHSQFSKLRANSNNQRTGNSGSKAIYPDMKLYQEIILLQHYCECLYCIENVEPYYDLLIPAQKCGRHLFWSNFYINKNNFHNNVIIKNITNNSTVFGINLDKYKIDNKRQILRNMVNPELGLYIFNCAFKNRQMDLLNV